MKRIKKFNMKKIVVLASFVIACANITAQQSAIYSQYLHNPFILNPAIAGTNNFFQIKFLSRLQWLGFDDAPVTNSISVFGPVSAKTKDMGYGVSIYNDITSLTSRSGIRGAYAYNRAINEYIRISFGAALGLMQYKYDGSKAVVADKAETSLTRVNSFYVPDAMIGTYVWSSIFQVGISVDNLFNSKLQMDPEASVALSKLSRHLYVFGSYKWIHNRRWETEYSSLMKYVSPAPPQFDLNVKASYKKQAWFGLSYRSLDAISVFGGYFFNQHISLGYSFDYNISSIQYYSFGSHELMIGYRFNSLK